MTALLWTLVGFLLGSIPFSLLVGRIALRTDIRRYGDGNPGATNVFRAGDRVLGMLALILDMLKGATPVALAYYAFGVVGWGLVPVVLAPILGHAFSPWLHFRGGKALAATFGAWSALTVPLGPFVMGLSVLAFYKLLKVSGWAVMAALLVLLATLLITRATPPVLVAWAGTVAILAWTHRADLRQPLRLR
jgi:glycerol-3-phosphate acyltransferase PlsY